VFLFLQFQVILWWGRDVRWGWWDWFWSVCTQKWLRIEGLGAWKIEGVSEKTMLVTRKVRVRVRAKHSPTLPLCAYRLEL
jgi:hypothetical protein